jgi:hypothetical protein
MREYVDTAAHIRVNQTLAAIHESPRWTLPVGHPFPRYCQAWPLANVALGVSVEDREHLNRIDDLRQTPAALRWFNAEPLLGDLGELGLSGLDWVVVGGESGPGARLCHPDWIRSIRDQCQAAAMPVFIKQLGSYVVDRNDAGFEGDEPESWPMGTDPQDLDTRYQGAPVRIPLRDTKGADISEWPADLRVRELPEFLTK